MISKDLIPDLDRYEGEGSLYSRQQVEVTSDKEKITVYAYVYLGSVESAPTKHEMWGINNEDIVWYACYGSNLSEERFLYYLEGGTCPLNGKTYRGCDDASYWKETAYAKVRGEMYFGNSSPSWNHKGVAFFDPNTEGTTYMKLYSIKQSQLLGVQRQEGLSDNWYGRILCLGTDSSRICVPQNTVCFCDLQSVGRLFLNRTVICQCAKAQLSVYLTDDPPFKKQESLLSFAYRVCLF